jgi:hypothetical protein
MGFSFGIFFRTDVLFFFYIGGLLQLRNLDIERVGARWRNPFMLAFVVLVCLRTIAPNYIPENSPADHLLFEFCTRILRCVGVAAIWLSSAWLIRTAAGIVLIRYGALAFFVFAAHWPLNQFVKTFLAWLIPWNTDLMQVANYLLTTVLTIALAILGAHAVARFTPRLFGVLSGGRIDPHQTAASVSGRSSLAGTKLSRNAD